MKYAIPLCVLFLVGCPAASDDDDTDGNLALDLTMADMPTELLDTIESLSAQITALQTAQNLTQTDVLALTGRVDTLELRMDEAEQDIDDLGGGGGGGLFYYEVTSANADGCAFDYMGYETTYSKTGIAVEVPFVLLFTSHVEAGRDSWVLRTTSPEDYTDCAFVTLPAEGIAVNGELQLLRSYGGPPTWSTGTVVVLHLTEELP